MTFGAVFEAASLISKYNNMITKVKILGSLWELKLFYDKW